MTVIIIMIIELNEQMNVNQFERVIKKRILFFASTDVMTSSTIDGVKRSNVCGEGYRIEGALLKSYPYSKSQSYSPYEDCYMTFKV